MVDPKASSAAQAFQASLGRKRASSRRGPKRGDRPALVIRDPLSIYGTPHDELVKRTTKTSIPYYIAERRASLCSASIVPSDSDFLRNSC
jgi:hypothetical protein